MIAHRHTPLSSLLRPHFRPHHGPSSHRAWCAPATQGRVSRAGKRLFSSRCAGVLYAVHGVLLCRRVLSWCMGAEIGDEKVEVVPSGVQGDISPQKPQQPTRSAHRLREVLHHRLLSGAGVPSVSASSWRGAAPGFARCVSQSCTAWSINTRSFSVMTST